MSGYSKEYNCLFIHIPKTAGHSIERSQPFACGRAHKAVWEYDDKPWFDDAFKFTFVRSPWDRFVSAFFHKAPIVPYKMADRNVETFRDYVRFAGKVGVDPRKMYPEPGRHEIHHHFCPQYWYVCNPRTNELMVDFVGKYEDLLLDLVVVAGLVESHSVQLPHYNKGNRGPYREYYDDECKEIIRRLYAEDIERFEYEFE